MTHLAYFISNKNVRIDHNYMDITYLTIQNSYIDVQLGLYKNNNCITFVTIHKHNASALLVETIKQALNTHHIKLTDLSFIAVNQGPGPFTTLRTVIATVNGLNFSLGIPLIGIDGIQALLDEYKNKNTPTIALLNAFNQDVYFAIRTPQHKNITIGSQNIQTLMEQLKLEFSSVDSCTFIGNGAELHQELITALMPHSHIESTLTYCSLHTIAKKALAQWHNKEYTITQLQPIYIKNTIYNNIDISSKQLP